MSDITGAVHHATKAICRDCLHRPQSAQVRCPECGSPRMVLHDELDRLAIAHIDCDAFYAAIEKRDNPALQDKPVIIGGGRRGVVSTACYVARIQGVSSAMPMFKALQACPDAVVIQPDMEKYSRVGREIRDMMRQLTPAVEPLSIDEAFLDLSGTERLHGGPSALVLAHFARRVQEELNLSVSIGLSYCKFLAKVASDLDKPRGFRVIGKAEATTFLRTCPVSTIWGVGKVMKERLERDGIERIADLQDMDESDLIRRYGSLGQRLARLSHGIDDRRVEPHSEAKSVSSETTFNDDIANEAELARTLRHLSEHVAARLKKEHLAGQTIMLKMKTADFRTRTRNRAIPDPTQLADIIYRTGRDLMAREIDGTRFRLIGIGVASLQSDENADPVDLVDHHSAKRASAERAMDEVRGRFGTGAVGLGITFDTNNPKKPAAGK